MINDEVLHLDEVHLSHLLSNGVGPLWKQAMGQDQGLHPGVLRVHDLVQGLTLPRGKDRGVCEVLFNSCEYVCWI